MDLLSESIKGRLLFAIPKKGRLLPPHSLPSIQKIHSCGRKIARQGRRITRWCGNLAIPTVERRFDCFLRCRYPIHSVAQTRCLSSQKSQHCVVSTHLLNVLRRPLIPSPRVFLPAADIPRFVGEGNLDLGITGRDMVLESQMGEHTKERLQLGFGKCALQVQVPERGPITNVDELAGKKIVSSFEILSAEYFAALDGKLGLQGERRTKIEYIGGSVEAACALGLADGIVDLVGTSRISPTFCQANV